MKRSSVIRRNNLKSNKVPKAVSNIIESLCEIGYISNIEKREMLHRVKVSDLAVYEEVRELLLEMATDLKKVNS